MKQSRAMSAVEATANVVVGYVVAVGTQVLVLPMWGLQADLSVNLEIALVFTGISLVRSYVLRRAFNGIKSIKNLGVITGEWGLPTWRRGVGVR